MRIRWKTSLTKENYFNSYLMYFTWKGCRIGDIEDKDSFEVALGMSRKWDAREAGREVARDVIHQLKRLSIYC